MGAKRTWIMPLLAALVVACVGWWGDRKLTQASPRIAEWNVEHRAAWWVAHREAINQARAAELQPIESADAISIEIEDRTP
jgi:hypothetical protein